MEKVTCKYCGKEMDKVLMPPESDWQVEYFMICMNDDCPYYVRGWNWMKEQFKVNASYRNKYNPEDGTLMPIPVKSPDDMKDWVVKKFEETEEGRHE